MCKLHGVEKIQGSCLHCMEEEHYDQLEKAERDAQEQARLSFESGEEDRLVETGLPY